MQYPKHFSKIVNFYKQNKRLPSYREMLKLTGFKSTNAIHQMVNKLADQELISKDSSGKLIPGPKFLGLPMLGTVEAGWPSPAEEELADNLSLDEWLINNREATFMLKVSGESMIDAGIRPGDMLLVERGRNPKNNDIVVAEVDKQWTLKYFEKHGNQVTLVPANKKFKTIIPKDELNIAAVVVAVVRKYHT